MSETDSPDSIQPQTDQSRRRLLLAGTGIVGAVGAGLAAWPFVASWKPSAKARMVGAPVEVFIGDLEPGQMTRVQWRGQAIGIMRRTERMLAELEGLGDRLRDPGSDVTGQQPEYAKNTYRSIRPEILVLNIHCTHLGCVPELRPEIEAQPFDQNWKGGFYCPCHKSTFDLAGRVFRGVPAQLNLLVPPYHFIDEDRIVVGVDPEQGVA
ncbi:ubiquinol-cytochrome c reductase iron-sulfur subunit [Wenzhouxiangella marina]|uniref:Ubiquinol-cytochrome c reductase iron-sulfur subunit n=1 Tax=Wenzhouxiangella marina TaxID=1579979 RepID=A0A0K0XVH5_9GAMM|nr:ubiquinol-cytochrome c reductase iron-sulfur subunit [Wenzhouxiangella marina]AKS41675.1 Ubiquinol-cytochrome c reductase, iron-sulfur subunit domain protein [Wenzhouxiangella marina]MBB6086564.1 ubiquinol-cytochrome c reductase iron-sulfur subunit [Wenzhouxiangella marina]